MPRQRERQPDRKAKHEIRESGVKHGGPLDLEARDDRTYAHPIVVDEGQAVNGKNEWGCPLRAAPVRVHA